MLSVVEQWLALVTVRRYIVVLEGVTVMLSVVSPVFHWYWLAVLNTWMGSGVPSHVLASWFIKMNGAASEVTSREVEAVQPNWLLAVTV